MWLSNEWQYMYMFTLRGFPPLLLVILSVMFLTSEQGWNPQHLTTTRPSCVIVNEKLYNSYSRSRFMYHFGPDERDNNEQLMQFYHSSLAKGPFTSDWIEWLSLY